MHRSAARSIEYRARGVVSVRPFVLYFHSRPRAHLGAIDWKEGGEELGPLLFPPTASIVEKATSGGKKFPLGLFSLPLYFLPWRRYKG